MIAFQYSFQFQCTFYFKFHTLRHTKICRYLYQKCCWDDVEEEEKYHEKAWHMFTACGENE